MNVNDSEEMTVITNWLLFLGGNIKIREVTEEILEGIQERLCFSAHRQCLLKPKKVLYSFISFAKASISSSNVR